MKQSGNEIDDRRELRMTVRDGMLEMRPTRALGGFLLGILLIFALLGLLILALSRLHTMGPALFHADSDEDAERWLSLIGIVGGVLVVVVGFQIAGMAAEWLRWNLALDRGRNEVRINGKIVSRMSDIVSVCTGLRPEPGTTTVALTLSSGQEIAFMCGFMTERSYNQVAEEVAAFAGVPLRNDLYETMARTAARRESARLARQKRDEHEDRR